MIAAATAERLEAALGAIDSAARKLPACPAGPVLAVLGDLDRARSELAAVLGRPIPAPAGDELDDDFAIPDGDPED